MKKILTRTDQEINNHASLASLELDAESDFGDTNTFKVLLGCSFGPYTSAQIGGHLRYNLLRAELHLVLLGCETINNSIKIDKELRLSTDIEMSVEKGGNSSSERSNKAGQNVSAKFDLIKNFPVDFSAKVSSEKTDALKQEENLTSKTNFLARHCNISFSGGKKHLHWTFTPPLGEATLSGRIPLREFFEAKTLHSNMVIDARISAAPDDIEVSGVGGLWPSSLSERKRRVLRGIALSFLQIRDGLCKNSLSVMIRSTGAAVDNETPDANQLAS